MSNERSGIFLRAALCVLAMLLLAAPALAESDGVTTYRALLIGNSDYQERAGYESSDLVSCLNDLSAMKSALASGTVRYQKMSVLSNLTASGIASAVNGVRTWGMDGDDVTIFYYTGHGASSGLVGTDLNKSGTAYNLYSFSLLQSALGERNVPGKVIVLLDSCESGGLINKSADAGSFTDNAIAAFSGGGMNSKAVTSGDHFHVIASSSQTQSSWAKTDLYGLTTWALTEAMGWAHNGAKAGNRLTSLEGDVDGDLTVTVGEAYAYAAGAVTAELKKYGKTQAMKAYPENSGLTLVSRAASSPSTAEIRKSYVTTMNLTKACIAPGMTLQLDSGLSGTVSWTSSKPSIATVDKHTGIVTGIKYSSSSIATIMALSGSDYTTCDVRVLPSRYVVQTVRLKYAEKSLEKGLGYTMPAKLYPASARYKKLRWSSDNEAVAKVHSTSGRIVTVADSGTATITATATSGVTAIVKITATPARARSVSLNHKTRTLIPGQSFMLTQTVLPATTANKSVKWESSKPSIAEEDDTGLVTANTDGVYGKTVISATTENNKKAYCVVTVVRNQSIPRTRPKSAYGKLVSSAYRIYYNKTGSLVIDMWFYNRTGYAQRVPTPNPGLVVLKLKNVKQPLYANVALAKTVRVPSGGYRPYTFQLNLEDYPVFSGRDLRGSDAWYEAAN